MRICIYGAASNDIRESYITETEKLGELLAESGHSLVFGGGASGLMGAAARGFHRKGAEIIGVAPSFFKPDGVLYTACTEFIYTETMRERKQAMEDRSDAFLVTPGGIGTFEEFFEVLTLKQLGRHTKPIAVLNTGGYFDALESMLKQAVAQRFMKEGCLSLYKFCATPAEVLDYLETAAQQTIDPAAFKHFEAAAQKEE
jgi:uncharacterized protein (TIGR00730 family)